MGNTLEGAAGKVDVLIIGGGPTGIGAAYRLNQHNSKSWILLDAEKQPGGLAGSVKTHEGFRFDHGYKTLCSRYDFFDRIVKDCFGEDSPKLQIKARDNYVYVKGQMVRFPLQNNLSGLPESERLACALDLLRARIAESNIAAGKKHTEIGVTSERDESAENNTDNENPQKSEVSPPGVDADESSDKVTLHEKETLDSFLLKRWGESLCNILFRPYIFKSFAFPTSKLSADWAEYKILPSQLGIDIEKIIDKEQSDPGLDSESSMIYPSKGGLVSLWRGIVRKLPKESVRFRSEIIELDIDAKTVRTKEGLELSYEFLISTMPLTSLLELAGRSDLNESLIHSSLYILCLGVRGSSPHKDITGCIYFPESDCIFHRACIFSSFDPESVPQESERIPTMRFAGNEENYPGSGNNAGPYWSLMLEVSAGPLKTISDATIMDEAIRDACSVGLLRGNDEIVSIHMTEMTHGQPLPTLDSDEKVDEALRWLESKGIYSRGRFGSFKYHIGDLDHCFIQGVEAADSIAVGIKEKCLWRAPDEMDVRSGSKIPDPVFDLLPSADEKDDAINAGEIRNAITREPSCSTSSLVSSSLPISRTSSQIEESSKTSDTE